MVSLPLLQSRKVRRQNHGRRNKERCGSAREISDMDEGVVEGRKDVRNTENQLA